jgi:UDP-N-acetylglucosamine:LPS N-acetylglucosamine transferase
MKILYAIQGTGNGHLSRAVDIVPELKKYGQLDLFGTSGSDIAISCEIQIKGSQFLLWKERWDQLLQNVSAQQLKGCDARDR